MAKMKTNQLMTITVGDDAIEAYHATKEIVLADVWRIGNSLRMSDGLLPANQTNFINSKATQDFIRICEENNKGEPVIRKEGRGKNSKTFVSLHLAIYAAEYLSPRFHYEIIDTFINSKILEWRDEGGDLYKGLTARINRLPDRIERAKEKGMDVSKSNHGVFNQIGKMIKVKITGDPKSNWNEQPPSVQRDRAELEKQLITFMDMGFVSSYDELKNAIEKMK